jgi:hypothetical protein
MPDMIDINKLKLPSQTETALTLKSAGAKMVALGSRDEIMLEIRHALHSASVLPK